MRRTEPHLSRFWNRTAANLVVVPYRENRAVLFRSRLLHYSDRPEFAEGYEDHRINITLLFGRRAARRDRIEARRRA